MPRTNQRTTVFQAMLTVCVHGVSCRWSIHITTRPGPDARQLPRSTTMTFAKN